jgi:glycolate oxidase
MLGFAGGIITPTLEGVKPVKNGIERGSLFDILASIVGSEYVSGEDFELWCHSRDGSCEPPQIPSFVVMPRTTDEISRIVRVANEFKIPLWPRGGGTGIDACGMPLRPGGIVVDMTQMNKLLEINEDQMTVTVQAGMVLRTLEQKMKEKGLHPRILGSMGSGLGATVAGGITTGAFAMGSGQYGNYCEQLVSMEVVLPNGDIIRTGSDSNPASGKFARYANGPDVAGLFCVSHGIFGIITEVTIQLVPQPEAFEFATVLFPTKEATVRILKEIGKYELVYHYSCLFGDRTVKALFSPDSTAQGIMCAILQGRRKEVEYKKELLDNVIKDGGGHNLGPEMSKKLLYDDDPFFHIPAISKLGRWVSACNVIPPERMCDFDTMAEKFFHEEKKHIFEKYGFRGLYLFVASLRCHFAVANMIMYDEDKPEVREPLYMIWEEWRSRIVKWGGVPYHIGAQFGKFVAPQWSGPYYSFIRTLKEALDPNNIMNPGMFGNI